MPRSEAQAAVKRLAGEAKRTGRALPDLVAEAHPDLTLPPLTGPETLGAAPDDARSFASAARAIADGQG
jgi:3-carboxy-cis,cis-muconate cycloisomerase